MRITHKDQLVALLNEFRLSFHESEFQNRHHERQTAITVEDPTGDNDRMVGYGGFLAEFCFSAETGEFREFGVWE